MRLSLVRPHDGHGRRRASERDLARHGATSTIAQLESWWYRHPHAGAICSDPTKIPAEYAVVRLLSSSSTLLVRPRAQQLDASSSMHGHCEPLQERASKGNFEIRTFDCSSFRFATKRSTFDETEGMTVGLRAAETWSPQPDHRSPCGGLSFQLLLDET